MGEVQLSGVGRGTALAVLIQQDVLCQLELIFQLIQVPSQTLMRS